MLTETNDNLLQFHQGLLAACGGNNFGEVPYHKHTKILSKLDKYKNVK